MSGQLRRVGNIGWTNRLSRNRDSSDFGNVNRGRVH